jgi:hypothetical protein
VQVEHLQTLVREQLPRRLVVRLKECLFGVGGICESPWDPLVIIPPQVWVHRAAGGLHHEGLHGRVAVHNIYHAILQGSFLSKGC